MDQQALENLGVLENPGSLVPPEAQDHLFQGIPCLLLEQVHPFVLSNHQGPGAPSSLVSLECLGILAHP